MYAMHIAVAVLGFLSILVSGQPSPPAPCGTLDLTSPLTQHCFPADGKYLLIL